MKVKKYITSVSVAALSLCVAIGSNVYAAGAATAKPSPGSGMKKEFNLEDYAKKLGIDTENKTEEQIKAAIKEAKLQKAKDFLIEKGLYKEGMTEKEIYKKVREYHKNNPK